MGTESSKRPSLLPLLSYLGPLSTEGLGEQDGKREASDKGITGTEAGTGWALKAE